MKNINGHESLNRFRATFLSNNNKTFIVRLLNLRYKIMKLIDKNKNNISGYK